MEHLLCRCSRVNNRCFLKEMGRRIQVQFSGESGIGAGILLGPLGGGKYAHAVESLVPR